MDERLGSTFFIDKLLGESQVGSRAFATDRRSAISTPKKANAAEITDADFLMIGNTDAAQEPLIQLDSPP